MTTESTTESAASTPDSLSHGDLYLINSGGNSLTFSVDTSADFTTEVSRQTGELVVIVDGKKVDRVPTTFTQNGATVSGSWSSDGRQFTFTVDSSMSTPASSTGASFMTVAAWPNECQVKEIRDNMLLGGLGGAFGGPAGATAGMVGGLVGGTIIRSCRLLSPCGED